MRPTFKALLAEARQRVDRALETYLDSSHWHPDFKFAAEHTMKGAGKAFRPAIVLGTCLEHRDRAVLDETELNWVLLSIEMLHTYSLVHDDLPSMDDDSLRRSKPTLHTLKGESYGILAGDAFLTGSFELLARGFQTKPQNGLLAIKALAEASGAAGMIHGQWVDLQNNSDKSVNLVELKKIHALKTGALVGAAFQLGALFSSPELSSEVDQKELQAYRNWGVQLGVLFQLKDDLLDQQEEEASLGKTANKDFAQGKDTAATLLSRQEQEQVLNKERELWMSLKPRNIGSDFSDELADFVLGRIN